MSSAVSVFTRTGTTWSQQHYVKRSNAEAYDEFGGSVALSRDGGIKLAELRGRSFVKIMNARRGV